MKREIHKKNINKVTTKKKEYKEKRLNIEKQTKEAINILSNLRTNIYQRIYYLITTEIEDWRQFNFLSSETKIENFIDRIEREIKIVKGNNFNFDKYRTVILCIVGKGANKFNEAIIKNMYIAKLQNIIFLLKKIDNDDSLKEVKNNTLTI